VATSKFGIVILVD